MIALSVDDFDVKCLLREDEGWSPDVRLDQNATCIAEKEGLQLQEPPLLLLPQCIHFLQVL